MIKFCLVKMFLHLPDGFI